MEFFLPTINTTAEYLSPEADGAVKVPGLWVDSDEAGDGGYRKESEHWDLWILVSLKDLHNSRWHRITGFSMLEAPPSLVSVAFLFTKHISQVHRMDYIPYNRRRSSYCLLCPVHAGFPAHRIVAQLHFVGFHPVPTTMNGKTADEYF